jgi:hypothetical protein
LQTLWPSAPKRFIFNGLELLEGMTFDFYGIRDGDSIIALPREQQSIVRTTQWIAMTRDIENFNEALKWMLNPKTSAEASRIRDLHLMKAEQRPRMLMRLCATIDEDDESSRSSCPPTVIAPPPDAPAREPLPVDWAEAGFSENWNC